jgi:hypothetical protein
MLGEGDRQRGAGRVASIGQARTRAQRLQTHVQVAGDDRRERLHRGRKRQGRSQRKDDHRGRGGIATGESTLSHQDAAFGRGFSPPRRLPLPVRSPFGRPERPRRRISSATTAAKWRSVARRGRPGLRPARGARSALSGCRSGMADILARGKAGPVTGAGIARRAPFGSRQRCKIRAGPSRRRGPSS